MPQYKLTYFDIQGLGESIRYMLSYARKDFEDVRISHADWGSLKASAPFGKLPLLEIDGKVYSDSSAICRYLGTEFGLAGANPLEGLQIDQKIGAVTDLLIEFGRTMRAEESAKAKLREEFVKEKIPFYFERFDKAIQQNGGYLANNKLSWGDIYFVNLCEVLENHLDQKFTADYHNIKALAENVRSQPGIQDWIKRRPKPVKP